MGLKRKTRNIMDGGEMKYKGKEVKENEMKKRRKK
jgi:hypothetical protein